jgi:hypothetical protein
MTSLERVSATARSGTGAPARGPTYREDMLAQDMPAWGSTALTLVSVAVLVSALVVAVRALWYLRNRK